MQQVKINCLTKIAKYAKKVLTYQIT